MKFSKLLDEYQLSEWKGSGNPWGSGKWRRSRGNANVVKERYTNPQKDDFYGGNTWKYSARYNENVRKYVKHKTRWIPELISAANQVFLYIISP
jgi:hypothetical protein